jgi:hypothetical protein
MAVTARSLGWPRMRRPQAHVRVLGGSGLTRFSAPTSAHRGTFGPAAWRRGSSAPWLAPRPPQRGEQLLQCSVDGQLRGDYVLASPALVADALDLGVGVGVFASIAGDCLLQPAVLSRLTADVDHGSVADLSALERDFLDLRYLTPCPRSTRNRSRTRARRAARQPAQARRTRRYRRRRSPARRTPHLAS